LKYKVTNSKGEASIEFNYSNAEWEESVAAVYKKNAKQFNIQGFRKGQAPKSLIEKYYGKEVFFEDAFEDLANEGYVKVLTESKDLHPVDHPKAKDIQWPQDGGDFKFTLTVTLRPEVILGDYKGIKIQKVEYNVLDSDVTKEVDKLKQKYAREISVTDRKVENGDKVILDYKGTVDGVAFDGGTAEKQSLTIGSNSFIPGFESQMIGLAVGDEKDLTVTFPVDYHAENLKGKDAVFSVKVHEILTTEYPIIDDEFISDTGLAASLKEYKADIKAKLIQAAEKQSENQFESAALDLLSDNSKVDIPKCMIDEELEGMLENFETQLKYAYGGLNIDDFFKYTKSSKKEYFKQNEPAALKNVKARLVIAEIVKKEKIKATEKDIEKLIAQKAKEQNIEVDKIKEMLDDDDKQRQIQNEVVINKLFEFIKANNEIEIINEKDLGKKAKEKEVKADTPKKSTAKKSE